MTKFSEKKQAQGDLPALRARLERAEKLVSALISDVEFLKQRLAKVEVVFGAVGKGKVDLDHDVTCMHDGRRPETD